MVLVRTRMRLPWWSVTLALLLGACSSLPPEPAVVGGPKEAIGTAGQDRVSLAAEDNALGKAEVRVAGSHPKKDVSATRVPNRPPPKMSSKRNKDRNEKKPDTKKPREHLPPARVERVPIDSTFFEMVLLDGGSFLMGSQDGDDDESPVHEVTLRPFSIGRYEVTQRQWEIVMGTRPSYFTACADCPVDGVSWNDTQLFIAELNRQSGKQFRLPSEAEWEYACLAGGSETYCGDSDETRVAWYAENSGGSSQPVGLLAPNGFGLYDMSGNAYEWVADCWHGGYGDAPVDGSAWASGDCQRRVLRGGAWYYAAAYALSTYRNANTPGSRFITYGFRLARDE